MSDEKVYQPSMPVPGYNAQSQQKVDIVTDNKEMEELILRKLDALRELDDSMVDKRWLAIGRTQMEQAWMAVNRAIFQPSRVTIRGEQPVTTPENTPSGEKSDITPLDTPAGRA